MRRYIFYPQAATYNNNIIFYILYKHQWNTRPFHFCCEKHNYVTTMVTFSWVKIKHVFFFCMSIYVLHMKFLLVWFHETCLNIIKLNICLDLWKSGKENFTPFTKYMMSNSKECHCFFLQSLFFFITWSDLQAFGSCEIRVCVGHLAQSEFFFSLSQFISPVKKIKPLLIVS